MIFLASDWWRASSENLRQIFGKMAASDWFVEKRPTRYRLAEGTKKIDSLISLSLRLVEGLVTSWASKVRQMLGLIFQ